ncbi:PP2C family protein-serine/threonine phosphatase [Novipirellula artificiosorum]|uniref:Phosphoserine phosphatase RsbU n=1 Tax=Novipirellula artificiosorum TaxID=2528016 RepID=A0A5C6DQB0_9BACT|nr:SpoIIE family protein phosphatase [Novipirellula artificiosorum]TWU39463.1 Phosphoserine phosphatase RsbU [Novipirellula artificiosorum]
MYRRLVRFWRRLPLNRQLLISVNSFLLVIVGLYLFLNYQTRISREMAQKRVSLSEEAKTLYESIQIVAGKPENRSELQADTIQRLIDSVCARMNMDESPGHHIAAIWQGKAFQAISHGHASPEMLSAMKFASGQGGEGVPMADELVVGSFGGPDSSVYVSEQRSSVIQAARETLAMQSLAVLAAVVFAAFIVNLVLRKVVSKPVNRLVAALRLVAGGNLSVIAEGKSCRELNYLADQINSMTRSLDKVEQDRRVHMETARKIQEHLLPRHNGLNGLQVAELFEPAEAIGGDYYDVVPLSEHQYLLCLADVTGHGVPAAMAASVVKALVLEAIQFSKSPAEILTRINRRYNEIIMPGYMTTMVVIVVDTRQSTVSYANAGHEPPFLQPPSGEIRRLLESDLVLGVENDVVYEEQVLDVTPGTKIVVVSDGVTEMFDPDENQFGTEQVVRVIEKTSGESVDRVIAAFAESFQEFRQGRAPFDDTTLLVAEIS